MNVSLAGTCKSLTAFEWLNIPLFSVVTGLNGVGKTQLLKAIHDGLQERPTPAPTRAIPQSSIDKEKNSIKVTGFYAKREHVPLVVRGVWKDALKTDSVTITDVQEQSAKLWKELEKCKAKHKESISRNQPTAAFNELHLRIASHLGKQPQQITEPEFRSCITAKDISAHDVMTCKISSAFYAYRVKQYEAAMDRVPDDVFLGQHGLPPWQTLEKLLVEFGLPFTFSNPSDHKLGDKFVCKLLLRDSNNLLKHEDLSAGEQASLTVVLWLFNALHAQIAPKLLLLDEPDAHLHPSMAKQLIRSLIDVLCDKHQVRVIMTTHSPSTVALCPEGSVFLMSKESPRIQSIEKQRAITSLTNNLVNVTASLRVVLVEDKADKAFYEEVVGQAVLDGSIPADPPLLFMSAGHDKKDSGSGGKTVVKAWTSKMNEAGLGHLIVGLVDRDGGDAVVPQVFTIGRYSIENYLLDPLVVYTALMNDNSQPKVEGVAIQPGSERLLRKLPLDLKQAIADTIHMNRKLLEQINPSDHEAIMVDVEFDDGTLRYPQWLISRRGKELCQRYYEAFDRKITFDSLLQGFRRTHAISNDLTDVIRRCQTG